MRDLTENVIISPGTVGAIHLCGTYKKGETCIVKIIPPFGSASLFDMNFEQK
jgi:hypothetical protein